MFIVDDFLDCNFPPPPAATCDGFGLQVAKKFHRDLGTVEDLNHMEMISDVDDPNRAN